MMTEKQVLVELMVELGVSFQKAAQRLASSGEVETSVQTNTNQSSVETNTKPAQEEAPAQEGFGLASMSNKEAMELVTNTEDGATLKAIGGEEKARGSKGRKGVLKAVQAKLEKLKNPPAQAEVVPENKAFTKDTPATNAADMKAFNEHFAKMTEDQRSQYFNGEVDSLGKSLVENTTTEAPSEEGFDDFEDMGTTPEAPSITEGELRAKFQAYAKLNGQDAARAVLVHFGVKKIKEIDASKYGEVAAELA